MLVPINRRLVNLFSSKKKNNQILTSNPFKAKLFICENLIIDLIQIDLSKNAKLKFYFFFLS